MSAGPAPGRPLRALQLFANRWQHDTIMALLREGALELHEEGFELLSAGGLWRCLRGEVGGYAERLVRRYRGRVDAVWSHDEGLGTLLAAVVARALGLPGTDPRAIVRCQHKLLLRLALAAACPSLSVPAVALPWPLADRRVRKPSALATALAPRLTAAGLTWPLFCKPARGTFSLLARRVDDIEALCAHLRLPWSDRTLLTLAARPFAALAGGILPLPCRPDCLVLEMPLAGAQINVDGYVHRGRIELLGVVDEWLQPGATAGTRHFCAFTYPSQQPAAVQQRLREAAAAAVAAVGYDHGVFNVELFVLEDGSVKVIEVNPRSAGQFISMYQAVDGFDLERFAIALAAGIDPATLPRRAATAGAAGSFVFRSFDGRAGAPPDPAGVQWLRSAAPEARLWLEPTSKAALRREYRWFGSHRHAVLNLAAADLPSLHELAAAAAQRLFGAASPVR